MQEIAEVYARSLFQVAQDNSSKVNSRVAQEREARHRQHEPILLRRRDNSVVEEPASPSAQNPASQQSSQPQ